MGRLASTGRKKIQLKKIEDERGRAVTLSKRHNGLFKKAGELATLCGVYIAIIVFTIGGKPLSFGSPGFQSVIKKFLKPNQAVVNQQPKALNKKMANSCHASKLQWFNQNFNEVNEQLVNNRKRAQVVEESVKGFLGGKTYEQYTSTLRIEELTQLKYKLKELKRQLENNCDAKSGSFSSYDDDDYEVDLSKIEGPKDYIKL